VPEIELVAFVNTASGGKNGEKFMEFMRRFLGKNFVFDLQKDKGAERGLRIQDERRGEHDELRVLACGGDGTFSWVAGAIAKLELERVVLLPVALGSGNDMSRALGWGHKYPGTARFAKLLEYVEKSGTTNLDVWGYHILCKPPLSSEGLVERSAIDLEERRIFCNYMSVGVDAQVELKFNEARWENPNRFNSRVGNIAWHAAYGAKLSLRDGKVRRLDTYVESLYVNDQPVPVPENVQALMIMNIPSYAAGATPWGIPNEESDWRQGQVDDRQLEVMALINLNHFVRVKAAGRHALRLAQGEKVQVNLKEGADAVPVQADGEPWRQECGNVIVVELARQLPTVVGPQHKAKLKNHAKFEAATNVEKAQKHA